MEIRENFVSLRPAFEGHRMAIFAIFSNSTFNAPAEGFPLEISNGGRVQKTLE